MPHDKAWLSVKALGAKVKRSGHEVIVFLANALESLKVTAASTADNASLFMSISHNNKFYKSNVSNLLRQWQLETRQPAM